MGIFRRVPEIDILRYIVVLLGGGVAMWIIVAILGALQGAITGTAGVIVSGLLVFVAYLGVLKTHPGVENILQDVIPIILLGIIITPMLNVLGVTLPLLTMPVSLGLEFAIAIVSLFAIDTIYLKWKSKR